MRFFSFAVVCWMICSSFSLYPSINPLEINSDLQNVSCNGLNDGSITLFISGGSGSYTYEWSENGTESSIENLSPGNYFVTIDDGAGCTNTAEFEIIEPPIITTGVANINDASCNGEADGAATVSVAGGNGLYTYEWPNGSAGETADSLAAGVYLVTITDHKGCSAVQSIEINEFAPPTTGILSLTSVECFGEATGSATISVAGGGGLYSYEWEDGSTDITNLELAAGANYFTVTDYNECAVVDSVVILQAPEIMVAVIDSMSESSVGNQDGFIEVDVWGGLGDYTYRWSRNDNVFSTNEDITSLYNGYYQLEVTDSVGCVMLSDSILLGTLTSIISPKEFFSLDIYPNPTKDFLHINFEKEIKEIYNIYIINTVGKVVYYKQDNQQNTLAIPLEGLPPNIYFLKITMDRENYTTKFILEK